MFINAKYNGVIKDFTEEEIITIAKKQSDKWEFNYSKWAYTIHSNNAVLDYFDSIGVEYTCETTKDDSVALEWISRGYSVWIWIKVNKEYFNDRKDGSLDLEDYSKYKGTQWHFTNVIKWTARGKFKGSSDIGKEMFLDSYFTTNSTYKCDIKKVLKELDQPTKYIIY